MTADYGSCLSQESRGRKCRDRREHTARSSRARVGASVEKYVRNEKKEVAFVAGDGLRAEPELLC